MSFPRAGSTPSHPHPLARQPGTRPPASAVIAVSPAQDPVVSVLSPESEHWGLFCGHLGGRWIGSRETENIFPAQRGFSPESALQARIPCEMEAGSSVFPALTSHSRQEGCLGSKW